MAYPRLFLSFSTLLITVVHVSAQDFYGEPPSRDITFWKNMGQLRRLNGTVETGVKFYSDGTTPQVFMQAQSIVDFVLTQKAAFPGGLDVVNHVNMKPHGENANLAAPTGTEVRDYYLNY